MRLDSPKAEKAKNCNTSYISHLTSFITKSNSSKKKQ